MNDPQTPNLTLALRRTLDRQSVLGDNKGVTKGNFIQKFEALPKAEVARVTPLLHADGQGADELGVFHQEIVAAKRDVRKGVHE